MIQITSRTSLHGAGPLAEHASPVTVATIICRPALALITPFG